MVIFHWEKTSFITKFTLSLKLVSIGKRFSLTKVLFILKRTFYSSFSICKIVARVPTGRITSLFAFFGEALVLTAVSILLLQSSYRLEWKTSDLNLKTLQATENCTLQQYSHQVFDESHQLEVINNVKEVRGHSTLRSCKRVIRC